MRPGAIYLGNDRCEFIVWGPLLKEVTLNIVGTAPRQIPMERSAGGYWRVTADNISPGTEYLYQLDGDKTRPDPASYYQPGSVHEPSQVIDRHAFVWQDRTWRCPPLADWIIYELHVGTFTEEGTFAGIIPRLQALKELGINAIELMPVAQFPGSRNWGYDGVYPYAVQNSYGGPSGLKQLVNACHEAEMAVILDVVYNHFGPEGNYTRDFAPYFTEKYHTPWGSAINFDDAYSAGVRNFFVENALYWLQDYHVDALRLDAVHAIYDFGAKHFLAELAEAVESLSQQEDRPYYLIAESDLNDVRVIRPQALGGYGIDAQWSDDFHHALHTVLTGEQKGYYQDFGKCEQLAKAWRDRFVYAWDYSPHRQRYHGSYAGDRPPEQFVVCSQNHDQVGNRMLGERLSQLVSFAALKLAAATVLLSPCIPLLFMGEEYGEESPFLYFISHGDSDLTEAVRRGRKAEFEAFHEVGEPPDAASPETFKRCILKWEQRSQGKHQVLLELYRQLIGLRRQKGSGDSSAKSAKTLRDRKNLEVLAIEKEKILIFRRGSQERQFACIMNFNDKEVKYTSYLEGNKRLDSSAAEWLGDGSTLPESLTPPQELTLPPQSFAIYEQGNVDWEEKV
ncbi:MAG: malto-oligosyltrehalose trehalohydrolase [Hormoscilla sp. GM7CHS1pb]|nr:malto-oligosyltrehalose trehalohydrolase [Hormoscilla sp. GM7CHS1pb]